MHSNLKAHDVAIVVLGYFCHIYTAISELLIKILASPLDSESKDPISWKGAIIWRSDDVFTLGHLELWHLTLNVCGRLHRMSRDQTLYQIWLKSKNLRWNYRWCSFCSTSSPTLGHAVTLILPFWPWTFVVDGVSCEQTLYQIWAKSNNSGQSYWSFSKLSHISHPRITRNSSGDEVTNVNCLYDDIVQALQSTIYSCIDSATNRRGYVSEHKFTKFSKIS